MEENKEIIIEIPSLKKNIIMRINQETTIDEVLDSIISYFHNNIDEKPKENIKRNLVLLRKKRS